MCGEAMRRSWLLLLASVGGVIPAVSQIGAGDKVPIEVEMVLYQTSDGQRVASRVRNVSEKEVLAYVACEPQERPDSGYERIHLAVFAMARPPHDRLRPGEVRQGGSFGGTPLKVSRATVDYVLFADGSSWGPDSKRQSLQIRGLIEGRRATIAELKRVLETQGSRAVEEILKAEQP